MKKKIGRLSKEEEEVIYQNIGLKSDEEIAAMINRETYVIARYRAQAPILQVNESLQDIIQQLHKKFFWPETQEQLMNTNEIKYFESYWANLVQQFAPQGIMPTDELMMRDLVMLDIHINRSSRAKKNANQELEDIDIQVEDTNREYADDPITRVSKLQELQTRANAMRGALKALAEEYKILAEKKDKKYDQLKATRQLRLEKAEKAGRSFYDLIAMLDTPEVREREGRLNELFKQATDISRAVFEKYHKYDDGKLDRPFLTPESEESKNE